MNFKELFSHLVFQIGLKRTIEIDPGTIIEFHHNNGKYSIDECELLLPIFYEVSFINDNEIFRSYEVLRTKDFEKEVKPELLSRDPEWEKRWNKDPQVLTEDDFIFKTLKELE